MFTTKIGTPISHSNLRRDFKQLLKKAGLPKLRFHDLRHTCATLLIGNGLDYKTVSERLGHARASITLDIYHHSSTDQQKKAADLIDKLVTPISISESEISKLQSKSVQSE